MSEVIEARWLLFAGDTTLLARPGVILVTTHHDAATNFVKVSTDNGTTEPGLIPPGSFWGPCKIKSGVTVYVRADTATCSVATIVCAA